MMLWPLYRGAARLATPLIRGVLAYRVRRGKEDPERLPERWGQAGMQRPGGPLVWFHAASIGESLSLLPLLDKMLDARPELHAVVTTVTTTSAAILAKRLPSGRAWHQYSPVDHPTAIGRFLDHWAPDLAIWIESEFWPMLLLATRARRIPMALVNARLSDRSWRSWQRFPSHINALVGSFDIVLAQDRTQAARFEQLGARHAEAVGNLKAEPAAMAASDIADGIDGDRPRWLAASTHPGEEALVLEAHRAARVSFPGLLTILAPRHPARTEEILALTSAAGLRVAQRSRGEMPVADTDIWLIDTLGELGAVYGAVPIILIGGSFATLGGHSPAEAAVAGAAILFGPDMANSVELAEKLAAAGAAIQVDDGDILAAALIRLLSAPREAARMGHAAAAVAAAERGVAQAVFERLEPLLPPAAVSVAAGAYA